VGLYFLFFFSFTEIRRILLAVVVMVNFHWHVEGVRREGGRGGWIDRWMDGWITGLLAREL